MDRMIVLLLAVCVSFASAIAPPCNVTDCKLPQCRCSGTAEAPGGLPIKKIPQMVILTYDDAVTDRFYNMFYTDLDKRMNPNGCKIGVTYFVSHEYCDYTLVHDLWTKGHEIAIHSISHKADTEYWRNADLETWKQEMVGMRDILKKFALIPEADMKGIRAPFLQTGGNVQFEMMQNNKFLWDCSMPTISYAFSGFWPFSLKYENEMDCPIGPCPDESFKDVWVIPMIDLFDKDGIECAMLDTCRVVHKNETLELLKDNFHRFYNDHRAPFGLYIHAAWFLQGEHSGHYEAYKEFLDYIKGKDDVYIVTPSQALEWTRNPTSVDNIKNFAPWKTTCTPKANKCRVKQTCKLNKVDPMTGGERYMRACLAKCPCAYPWVGDPLGTNCGQG